MKSIYFISALALVSGMAQAQTQLTIRPGSAILASLVSQHNSTVTLHPDDIISDSQSGAGYKLSGEILLQLHSPANFSALAASYNLQLKHSYGDIMLVTAADTNTSQLVAQLAQEPTVRKVTYDLQELGLSPDPEVINDPK